MFIFENLIQNLASMPRRDESTGFPKVSSMPSIRKYRNPTTNWTHKRSVEAENLRKISSTASPFDMKKNFTPISMSTMRGGEESDDDDEAHDQLTGET